SRRNGPRRCSGPVGGELGPRDVDAVPVRAAGIVVDREQLLVFENRAVAGWIEEHRHVSTWEVPGGAVVLCRAKHDESAGLVGVRRCDRAAVEQLTAEVRVAPRIPRDGGVAPGLPILAREARGSARKAVR